jgi:aspartokinase
VRILLDAVADAAVPALHLDTDMESADLWFALDDVPDWKQIRARLEGELELDVLEGAGAVSVVGDRIGADIARIRLIEALAAKEGIEIVAMSTSPLRVSLFCDAGAVDVFTKAVHRELVEKVHQGG